MFGIAYWDAATDTSFLIGKLQDSQGMLVGSNSVVYANAFQSASGATMKADIVYQNSIEGFEQNIVFKERLPSPADLNMDPASTKIQILTEFFEPPQPSKLSLDDGVQGDAVLAFGSMAMGIGEAFYARTDGGSDTAAQVTKRWERLENRDFLIEELPFSKVEALQARLPAHASLTKPIKISRLAALRENGKKQYSPNMEPVTLAKNYCPDPGFVIDYSIVNAVTNFTFQGDTTYYISGTATFRGTCTFEGGAVLKYAPGAKLLPNNAGLSSSASVVQFLTQSYLPCIFTARDDDTAGEIISGSTGNPRTNLYANPALQYVSTNVGLVITNARFSYASQALEIFACCSGDFISDVQFVNCSNGIWASSAQPLAVENVLFANCSRPFNSLSTNSSLFAQNVTFSKAAYVATLADTNQLLSFVNCVFSEVTNIYDLTPASIDGDHNGFFASPSFGTAIVTNSSNPFQVVGGGGYYLTNGCAFLEAGTMAVDNALLLDLSNKTVFPPLIVAPLVWVTNATNLSIQAPRDWSSTPSLGYHYDPIDWALHVAISNATVTCDPGVALCGFGPQYGMVVYNLATASFQGTALQPCHLCKYNLVQEQSNTNWISVGWYGDLIGPWNGSNCLASLGSVIWTGLAGESLSSYAPHLTPIVLRNCQMFNGNFWSDEWAYQATNNLFRRVSWEPEDGQGIAAHNFFNNLFIGGDVYPSDAGSVSTFKDNLFDHTINGSYGPPDVYDYNGYVTTNYGTLTIPPAAHDVILSNSPAYQTGLFGSFYYPGTLTQLIHKGSRLASTAGLSEYTTTIDNVAEGTNIVSIGLHFVTAPTITAQPTNQTVNVNANAFFNVTAAGTEPLSYQWNFDGDDMSNATNATLNLTAAQLTQAGVYSVTISGPGGSVTSSNVMLFVNQSNVPASSLAFSIDPGLALGAMQMVDPNSKLAAGNGYLFAFGNNPSVLEWNASQGWQSLGDLHWSGESTVSPAAGAAMFLNGTKLYIGGTFESVGGVTATNIAMYDILTATWSAVGTNTPGASEVTAIVADTNNTLYVGLMGSTNVAPGSVDSNMLMVLNSNSWKTVGTGMIKSSLIASPYGVSALATSGSDIYAAGGFDGAVSSSNVYSYSTIIWSPSLGTWRPMGNGSNDWDYVISGGPVMTSIAIAGTNVFVAGSFTGPYGMGSNFWPPAGPIGIARYSLAGARFSDTNALLSYSYGVGSANALATLNANVFVAGSFDTIGSLSGTTNSPTNSGLLANGVAVYTSTGWSNLSTGITVASNSAGNATFMTADPNAQTLTLTGSFDDAGGVSADVQAAPGIVQITSTPSSVIAGSGFDGPIYAVKNYITTYTSGGSCAEYHQLIVGGAFKKINGVVVNHVASFDGTSWHGFGSGSTIGVNQNVFAIEAVARSAGDTTPDVYVGGTFTDKGKGIAKWSESSSSWSALSSGVSSTAFGNFYSPTSIVVRVIRNIGGSLWVGGRFATAGGVASSNLAAWNLTTSSWTTVGTTSQFCPSQSKTGHGILSPRIMVTSLDSAGTVIGVANNGFPVKTSIDVINPTDSEGYYTVSGGTFQGHCMPATVRAVLGTYAGHTQFIPARWSPATFYSSYSAFGGLDSLVSGNWQLLGETGLDALPPTTPAKAWWIAASVYPSGWKPIGTICAIGSQAGATFFGGAMTNISGATAGHQIDKDFP
ncbi:MAG TPA: immunoglobulin domain-containing protein, partial [Verrucomicrobiae bacterium]|nr:immunoglobulin domain-containing protein [Verrucomicrobiae bacterium]